MHLLRLDPRPRLHLDRHRPHRARIARHHRRHPRLHGSPPR
jgi:hypothetical protein